MNEPKITSLLTEYIIPLLSHPELMGLDIDQFTKKDFGNQSVILPESENIRMAYELIHFMDEMPGGFFIYRADDKEELIYANMAMLRIFKCNTLREFQELTGNSFKGIVYSEDLDSVEQSIRQQIADSKYDLDYVEYRIVRKDGKIRWIEDYGHFIQSASAGNFFYVFASDATEKKQRQLFERQQSEQKLKNIINKYDEEINLINQEHLRRLEVIEGLSVNYETILYADLDTDKILPYRLSHRTKRQFEKIFQVRSFLWYVSDYINIWVHPEDREMVSKVTSPEYICKKLSKHKTYYVNYRILDGEKVQYLQLRIVDVGNREHISQIVMGYRRVDKEIQYEMEQKQILKNALDNANLAIIAKNTFLANMSHDMRTPLNAIFGFTALAESNIHNGNAVQKYLDKINTASSQLLGLIDKVLEISWTESNDINIVKSECNLYDIVQEVHRYLLPQASEKDIIFTLNAANLKYPDVYGDPSKIKQLLLHIANNAVTYTKAGGKVDMSVTELEILPNNYMVYEFEIKDTGIGISKEFLEHIFEPFEREKNTTFSGIHGTGLGLTITKNIVDMMGGNIKVDSIVQEGSTFTVTLPLHIQEMTASPSEDLKDAPNVPMNLKILLVEDNEINLEIQTELLRQQGFLIDTATDGSLAVEKITCSKPGDYDLILMDIQMPVMDGWQAAKAIRKLDNRELAHIPIIALSANAFESDKRTSLESGMNAHLTKPLDIPQLLETIWKITQKP